MNRNNCLFHRFGAVLVFCFIAVHFAGPAAAAPPPPYLSTGFPQVVVVSGTDHEMGVQYGEQTAPAIVHNVAIFKSRCYDGHGRDKVTKDMQVWNYYLEKYDPSLKDWLQGIMEGCRNKGYNVEYLDLVMLMVYPTGALGKAECTLSGRDHHNCLGPGFPGPTSQGLIPRLQYLCGDGRDDKGWKTHPRNNFHGCHRGNGQHHFPGFSQEWRQLRVPDIRRKGEFQLRHEQQGLGLDHDSDHVGRPCLGYVTGVLFSLSRRIYGVSKRGTRLHQLHAEGRRHGRLHPYRCVGRHHCL